MNKGKILLMIVKDNIRRHTSFYEMALKNPVYAQDKEGFEKDIKGCMKHFDTMVGMALDDVPAILSEQMDTLTISPKSTHFPQG